MNSSEPKQGQGRQYVHSILVSSTSEGFNPKASVDKEIDRKVTTDLDHSQVGSLNVPPTFCAFRLTLRDPFGTCYDVCTTSITNLRPI